MRRSVKLVSTFLTVFLISVSIYAGENRGSIMNLEETGLQGYGGPHFRGTWINGGFGVFGGGPVQLIFDDSWSAGLSVSYLEGDVNGMMVVYGGARGEYILFPGNLLHFSFGMTAGGGGAFLKEVPDDPQSKVTSSGLLVFEPEAAVLLNLTDSLRLGFVTGYRYARVLDRSSGMKDADISGFFAGLSIQQGLFGPSEAVFKKGGSRLGTVSFYAGKFAFVNGRPSFMDGGGTLLVIDKKYYIGANGYVFRGDLKINGNEFSMMQGGLFFEYSFFPERIISLSAAIPVGFAMAGYVDNQTGDLIGSGCALLEPGAAFAVGLTEFIRIRIGAAYRIGIGFAGVEGLRSINGPVVSIGVRFGEFSN
jgi:hypothetical protein